MSTTLRYAASSRPAPRARGWARHAGAASAVLLWVGVSMCLGGLTLGSPIMLAWTGALLGAGLALRDFARTDRGAISPITLYSVSAAVIGVANAVGLAAAETEKRPLYFLYAIDEHLFLAMQIMLAGGVLPVLAFWAVSRSDGARVLASLLPRIQGEVRERNLTANAIALAALVFVVRFTIPLDALGTIGSVFLLLPHFMVFILARIGAERGLRNITVVALGLALAEAVRASLFSYLRSEMLLPLLAFVFGTLLGRRSLEPLRWKVFYPIYGALVLFIIYFGAFGQVRGETAGGLERIQAVQEFQEVDAPDQAQPRQGQTVMSRLSTFNQLTQIRRIVEEDGFLEGETMEYLAFAFVPRVIWPEKPVIAKGQWFAGRIGQGFPTADGGFSNSINMTIQGELYLNFGWLGVVVGCVLFGVLLALLWMRAEFWSSSSNGLGGAFGFYLLWVGFGMGADFQILVTIIAVYGVFLLATWGLRLAGGTSNHAHARRPLPPRDTVTS
ncbi:MAG TPA: hypothetical protein VJ812_11360 [Gemmatimonadaceae bacterium]|nr:hypothetical protein [Gemmatimonadaceae bacterium]